MQDKQKKKWYKKWWVYAIILVVVYIGYSFSSLKVSKDEENVGTKDMNVRTIKLEKGNLQDTITADGPLASQHSISVVATRGNKIDKVLVAVGDMVTKDQPLIEQDTTDLRKEVARKQEELDLNAEYALNDKNQWWIQNPKPERQEGESDEDFNRRQSAWDYQFSQVNGHYFDSVDAADRSNKNYALKDKWEEINDCTIKAEQAGTITYLNANVGTTPDGVLARIDDVTHLQVTVFVDEWDILSVHKGMKAEVKSDAAGVTIPATVEAVALSKQGDKGFPVVVTLDESNDRLLIGMNTHVKIIKNEISDVYKVSMDTVGKDENGNSIVYVKKNDEFVPMTVQTGENNGWDVVISGDGLKDGMELRASANIDDAMINEPTPEVKFISGSKE